MTPTFGRASLAKLDKAHPDLRTVFRIVILDFDCTILESVRTPERAAENVRNGFSHTNDSRHLADEQGIAWAVDAAPYPVLWPDPNSPTYAKDLGRWYYFGGYVLGVANRLGIRLRWGGDWNGNRDIKDQSFDDLGHFEVLRAPGAEHLNLLAHPHAG